MSDFSTLFAGGFELLGALTGEAVSYQPVSGAATSEPQAIVGNEHVEERSNRTGLVKLRVREFSLRRSLIDTPLLNATIAYGGEDWPIKGIVSRDLTYTRVRCELPQLRDGSKGNHKPQI